MSADPNLAQVAMLIGEPARAAMLLALLGGQALPAGELAARAQVTPQTASAHLARLIDGGLVHVSSSGRHRYYRLSSREIGAVLEARALRAARTCYDHLAGALGVALTQRLLALRLLIREANRYHAHHQAVAPQPALGEVHPPVGQVAPRRHAHHGGEALREHRAGGASNRGQGFDRHSRLR